MSRLAWCVLSTFVDIIWDFIVITENTYISLYRLYCLIFRFLLARYVRIFHLGRFQQELPLRRQFLCCCCRWKTWKHSQFYFSFTVYNFQYVDCGNVSEFWFYLQNVWKRNLNEIFFHLLWSHQKLFNKGNF